MPSTPRSTRRLVRLSTPVLALAAGLAAAGSAAAGPAAPVTGFPGGSAVVHAAFFGFGGPSAPEVVEMLYRRYGALRVLYVRPAGDIYQAELIDRSGYRLHYTIDAYDGRVLERYIMGRNERPVPVPPGMVPGGQMMPDRMPPPPVEYQYRRDPGYPREAGLPPAATMPSAPVARRTVAPTIPSARPGAVQSAPLPEPPLTGRATTPDVDPSQRRAPQAAPPQTSVLPSEPLTTEPAPAPRRLEPRKPATARAEPAPSPELPKPAPVKPEVVRPVTPPPAAAPAPLAEPRTTTPPAREPARADVRPAVPSTARIPEPLIDPKTGRPTASVPVAPLDDAQKPTRPSGPMVPPATLD